MSENMNVKDIRDELVLLAAFVESILNTYSKPKSSIITGPENNPLQLELDSSDYMKGLFNNIAGRIQHLNEILVKLN